MLRRKNADVLRKVEPHDIAVFYDQQADQVSSTMAAVPTKDRAAHNAHWAKNMADPNNMMRTIVVEGVVVGNVVSFFLEGQRNLGYWLGREYWGRGYATRAVAEYLREEAVRPLYAHVADHNTGSLRVLAKNGFLVIGDEVDESDGVNVIELRLD
jgi:RimJ/RimL family protein N-acetyltransferase